MAIHIVNIDGLLVLKQIGVPADLIAQMQAVEPPLKIQLKNKKMAVTSLGEEVWAVPIETSDLVMIQKGKLDAAKKASLGMLVYNGISGLVGKMKGATPVTPNPEVEDAHVTSQKPPKVPGSAFAMVGGPKVVGAVQEPPNTEPSVKPAQGLPWQEVPASEMNSAARVKLADADRMYQPVFGTTDGSRYFVVAGSSSVKVAARYRDTTLSIRIEGKVAPSVIHAAKASGFKSASDGHLSVHFEVPDPAVAAKTLGAVVASLGVPFDTQVPQMSRIAGKGV